MRMFGMTTRDDQDHLMARGAVLRTESVDGGAKAAGARPIEVGHLNDTHTVQHNRRLCAVNDLTLTIG
jgi:hypothetical protein